MSELSPTARALLDAARDGLGPSSDALRRVRGKIDTAVVGASTGVALKLAVLALTGAVAVGALAMRGRDAVATPELSFGATTSTETREQRVFDPPPPEDIEMEATRVVAPPRTAKVVVEPALAAEPTVAPARAVDPAIDLAREVELVDAAMAAMRRGDANAALASVRIHRVETRNAGQLAEDAAAIEIEALCRLRDRQVATAKLEAFDARWPESAQRSRLTEACP